MKRKTLRKTLYLLMLLPLGIFAYSWVDMNYLTPIDTTEVDRYYDILSKHAKPANLLTLSTGVGEKENLQTALERLKEIMGLGKFSIDLIYGDQDTPPAFVENVDNEYMTITMSRKIKQRREELSALVHELSHISVWSLDPTLILKEGPQKSSSKSIFKDTDLEKVVDTSGIFRGQGVLSLNGLTDELFWVPGIEYTRVEKTMGYLKPEEFGYLTARYCAEHGIAPQNVKPFLEPGVRKFFDMGWHALEKAGKIPPRPSGEAKGIFWCSKCGEKNIVELSGQMPELQCSRCAFHFKGKKNWIAAVQEKLQKMRLR